MKVKQEAHEVKLTFLLERPDLVVYGHMVADLSFKS